MAEQPQADEQAVVLIDNHMIQYFLSKDTAPHLQDILKDIEEAGAKLGVIADCNIRSVKSNYL